MTKPLTKRQQEKLDALFTAIAQEEFSIETLETRRSDSLDFHEVAVWSIKRALERAYQAGQDRMN